MTYYTLVNNKYIKLEQMDHRRHKYKELYCLKESKYIYKPIFAIDKNNNTYIFNNSRVYTYSILGYEEI
jgi:hypothetical protein